jgi:hypothetical protein
MVPDTKHAVVPFAVVAARRAPARPGESTPAKTPIVRAATATAVIARPFGVRRVLHLL